MGASTVKTIMVIGANSYIGSNLVLRLRQRHKVIALFHRHLMKFPGVTHGMYDLGEKDTIKRMIKLLLPDVIIYCAGINDFVFCAQHAQVAEAVNSFGPVVFSGAADPTKTRFIYLSTAYVYDGKKGNFSETDIVFPETTFAKGKLAGENYVRSKSTNFTIFRFSPVYGLGSIYHQNRFDQIRINLERGERIELPQNEVHSFLSLDIALNAIEWAATHESRSYTYNLGGLTKVSWYEFGLIFADIFGFDKSLIVPGQAQFENDVDFSLNGTELIKQLQVDALVLEKGLDLFKKQLVR